MAMRFDSHTELLDMHTPKVLQIEETFIRATSCQGNSCRTSPVVSH